jgi:hypothetical protein
MIKTGSGTDTTIAAAGITVVINWTEELRRLVPTTR